MAPFRPLLACALLCFALSTPVTPIEPPPTTESVVEADGASSFWGRATDALGATVLDASALTDGISSVASAFTDGLLSATSGAVGAMSNATSATGASATGALVDATWLIISGAWTTAVPLLLVPVIQVLHTYLVVAASASTAFSAISLLAHLVSYARGSPPRIIPSLLGGWHVAIDATLCVLLAFDRLRARGAAEGVRLVALVAEACTGNVCILFTLAATLLLSTGVLVAGRRSASLFILHVVILVLLM